MEEEKRTCKKCGIEKPITEFKKTKFKYYLRTCKECYAILNRQRVKECRKIEKNLKNGYANTQKED